MTDIELPEAPAEGAEPLTGTLQFDAGKYRAHVDDLDLTEEQKAELLGTLWWIMATFVDLGFRVDSVQCLLPAFTEAASHPESGALRVDDEDCRPSLTGAAKQKEPKHEL
jgi:hypothetical protein